MKTSQRGIELIAKHEGFRPSMYLLDGKPHIGYGTLIDSPQEMYLKTATISRNVAMALLQKSLSRIEAEINKVNQPITQNMFDALASFGYNLGASKVTLMVDRLNKGWTPKEVADRMIQYVNAGGKQLPGLVKRRNEEVALFLSSSPSTPVPNMFIDASNSNKASISPVFAFLMLGVSVYAFKELTISKKIKSN
ncbi:MAG: lysozyme [Putridiphycobacter sp.]|nr:lysozyme [Putridiphycobacter sp.]